MNGLGRRLEDFGGSGESVERTLAAIEFQTAILTLNAAVEAASGAGPGTGSPARTRPVRDGAGNTAGQVAEGGREATVVPWRAGAPPPIAGSTGSSPPTTGNCAVSAAEPGVEARLWQRALERLRQSLLVARGSPHIDPDGRPQPESMRRQPAVSPAPGPAARRCGRSQPTQSHPRERFEHGP